MDLQEVSVLDVRKNELAFTQEELQALESAREMPITFDDDCPETTPEKAVLFKRVNPPRHIARAD